MAFGCLWCRSRVRAHFKLSGAEELLGLSQHFFLFKMHQSSSSYLHCKLKSMKILSDLSLNKTSFLDIAYMKLTEWKRKARKAQAFPQLIYFQWLARMVIPRTGELWQKCSIKSKFSTNICCCLFCDVHLIMVDSTQLVFVLEIWECYIKKLVQTSFKLSLLQSSNQQTD